MNHETTEVEKEYRELYNDTWNKEILSKEEKAFINVFSLWLTL